MPSNGMLVGTGANGIGISYSLALVLAHSASSLVLACSQLENTNARHPMQVDLTYAQDLALAPYGAVRMNEFYVSQYIDHMPN
jgi:cellobiose phosphorylase